MENTLSCCTGITELACYGVEVPGVEGRTGIVWAGVRGLLLGHWSHPLPRPHKRRRPRLVTLDQLNGGEEEKGRRGRGRMKSRRRMVFLIL